MFFGQRKEKQKVVVPGGVAHVFLYSTNSTFNATGFTITYNITEEVTTPAPITTTPTPILPDAFVPINGIPTTKWKDYNSSFTQAIAGMSTDYVHNVLGYVNQPNITSTMVLIQDIKSCNPFRCQKDCVAYDFSIDSDLFTKYTLDQMLNTESLHHYITQVNEGSQICEEHPTISLTRYVAVPVFILIFGIVISALFWKYSEKGSLTEKRLKYETEQQDRWDDQRRRSSANASILGLGRPASFASRGSRSSIPFPKSKGAQDYDSDDNVGFDMSDFREYDPDMGTVDPTQFGLDKDFTRDRQVMGFYTNQAFVPDEEVTVYQRDGPSHSLADTDSEDSNDGGAISFRDSQNSLSKTPQSQVVSADVHTVDDNEETTL
ncbi:uncharacterized protein LOC121877344 [Homarus americanus]|uniref:uncharacterized protein LOC121877344 n=1 Tax=Homarus americanus TaxID=6706 RepID=UPI001C43EF56|nr:uncharacterized protein LOC121877344 [Homarus americanus]